MSIYSLVSGNISPWSLNRFSIIYDAAMEDELVNRKNTSLLLLVSYCRYEARLLSLPYHTDCFDYDQHECMYKCVRQLTRKMETCETKCAKSSCHLKHANTLSWTAYPDKARMTSQVRMTQAEQVIRTDFTSKSSLSFVALNVVGLFGVFIGLSSLDLIHCARRLVSQPSKIIRRSAVFIGYLAAICHGAFIVEVYLQYGHNTEVYQGANVDLSKHAYTICLSAKFKGKHWPETKLRMPKFDKLVSRLMFSYYRQTKMISYGYPRAEPGAALYRANYTTQYTFAKQFCYRFTALEKDVKGIQFGENSMGMYSNIDLELTVNEKVSRRLDFAILTDIGDILPSNLHYETLIGTNTYKIKYTEIQSLPYPYKMLCENYGQGHLKDFVSRQHCADVCGLETFQIANPGYYPEDVPLLNGSDGSIISGKATPLIDRCMRTSCKRPDCTFTQFLISKAEGLYDESDLFFRMIKPNEEALLFSHVPTTDVIDTLLILSSAVSIWTGFSMMQFKKLVNKIFRKVKVFRRHRNHINSVITLIITVSFAFNIYIVIKQYMNYEFITESVVRSAAKSRNFSLIIVIQQQRQVPKRGKGEYRSSQYLENLLQHTWLRDTRTLSWVRHPSTYLANVTAVYILSSQEMLVMDIQSYLDKLKLESLGSMPVLKLSLKADKGITIFLTGGIDRASMGDILASMTSFDKQQHSVAKFESLVVKSLPAPFSFACINYLNYGYHNQANCEQSCTREGFLKTFNSVDSLFVPVNLDDNITLADNLDLTIENEKHINEFYSKCGAKCNRTSCLKETYYMKQASFKQKQEPKSISVDANVQETQITYLAKMGISEFIMYLGNTFSTWYGFCFIDVTIIALYCYNWLR
ncbi:hypothetical protein HDE_09601 [Halotydeus destructor]|nr:hypothetical protein HDE_09601 [Halotydeus destructor]